MMTKLFLIGMPGSGKTTLGRTLAARLKSRFIDLDDVIENTAGKKISSIFEEKGEDYFRQLESSALKQVIGNESDFVIATGGGAACFFDNMGQMKKAGTVLYLDVSLDELFERLRLQISHRPLLKDKVDSELFDEVRQKLEKRRPHYESADIIVKGDNISADDLLLAIERGIRR